MTAAKVCAKCGRPIPGDAPDGACPNCLFAAAFDTGAGAGGTTDAEPSPDELAPLFPGLTIESVLGRGGMGVVYKARHKALDRDVALKVLPAGRAGDAAFAERFQREARALAKLQHPNIVAVHDFGETAGLCWLVMEFVDGTNIRQAMAAGTIHPKEALAIVPQICDALQYAHEHGVVHRDIKPENVLLDRSGRVKVADFGLAKLMAADDADRTLTGAGQVMGTPHYMAPEQWERPKDVDHRADIYSLGVVFYEMLTGELPIGRFAAPSKKSRVDARIDEIVLRTLARERELRYQHVAQVKTDMGRASEPRRRRRGPTELPPATKPTAAELCRQDRGREAIAGALLFASGTNAWLVNFRPLPLVFVPLAGLVLLAFAAFGSFRPTLEPDAARDAWRRLRFRTYVVLLVFVLAGVQWTRLLYAPTDMWERASFQSICLAAFGSAFVAVLFLVGLMRRWNMVAFVLMLLLMGAAVGLLASLSAPREFPRLSNAASLAELPANAFRAEDGDGHALRIPSELRHRIDELWRTVRGRATEPPTIETVTLVYTPADLARLRAMSDDERAAKAARGALGLPLLPNGALPHPISDFELVRVRFVDPDYALGTVSVGEIDIEFRLETDRSDASRSWYFSAVDAGVK